MVMGNEMMDLDQLAEYLQRDARELSKLANRGRLPGHKVSGQWRFARAEINHWLETQMPDYTEQQLTALETADTSAGDQELLVPALLSPPCVAVPFTATTRASVLRR